LGQARLPCFGSPVIDMACQPCFANAPSTSALVKVDF